MTMGFGCNAAAVAGCRIIDSPRERLIAILTNSLVPCNGRFPTLITLITLFFLGSGGLHGTAAQEAGISGAAAFLSSLGTALMLTCFILLGVGATLALSWLLSKTVLKGVPSSFTLELPPYRKPQFGKVIVHSMLDRTLFVLGRAVAVAAPAGLIIWLLANVGLDSSGLCWISSTPAGDTAATIPSLLTMLTGALDPVGRFMGLDGVILVAFILGFPANEIVVPIILMAYLQTGHLIDMDDQNVLFQLLVSHGWTWKTALCMAVFSLFHWPCSTTCLTIRKETGSWKWTAAAIAMPTLLGTGLCILLNAIFQLTA